MSTPLATAPRRRLLAWVTASLGLAAALATVHLLGVALSPADAEEMEAPLAMSVARQLTEGPRGLYGPFGGENPQVLIHAPLYYRLSALLAWPLHRSGVDPIAASLAAGRLISGLGLLATALAAGGLARLGGGPPRAGTWAALLVLAAPVLGPLPAAVRPDLLGIALGTGGLFFVLSALADERPGIGRLTAGFAAFGLAACVKQHYVVLPAVCLVLLVAARLRGRLPSRGIERAALIAAGLVVAVYGAEEFVTGGQMSRAVLGATREVGRLKGATWARVDQVFTEVAGRSVGPAVLLAAAGLASVAAGRGRWRPAVAAVLAAGLLACTVAFGVQAVWPTHTLADAVVIGNSFVVPSLIVACAVLAPRALLADRTDAALWLAWLGETLTAALLCRGSTGSWVNYTIEAVVLGSVLTARVLARAIDAESPDSPGVRPLLVVIALVAPVAGLVAWGEARITRARREEDRASLARIFAQTPPSSGPYFFVDLPGLNRAHGRPGLAYDPWLYPVFESLRLAEPRAAWLTPALSDGATRVVVSRSPDHLIDGLPTPLPALGFRPAARAGPYYVWIWKGVGDDG